MTLKLTVEKRDAKADVAALRAAGKLRAVFYGPKVASTPIMIDKREFAKVFREAGETTVIDLVLDGTEEAVLVHEVTNDPVSDEVAHVDFYVVDKTQKVTVNIPLDFIGESHAVKSLGGTLVKVMHELEVEGLPGKLPQSVTVDISKLESLDSTISVKNLALPEGVEATADAEDAVAAIAAQREETEETGEVDLSSIEVEKKGKDEKVEE